MRNTNFPSRGSKRCARARRFPPRVRARRLVAEHSDFTRDGAAPGRGAVAVKFYVPRPGGGRCNLGVPEIGRPAMPLLRFGCNAAIGRDQRKLAIERLFRGKNDPQRSALPRRQRRGQDRNPGRIFANSGGSFGPDVHRRDKDDEKCACNRQQCRQSGSKPAC